MSLFDVESYFLLGHFQACVNSGHSFPADISKSHIQLKPLSRRTIPMLFRFTHFHCNSPSDQQSDIFLNRAHIELGNYSIVVDEIREDAPAALKCVKLLARLHLGEIQPQELLAQLTSIEESNAHVNDPHLQVVLGAAFIRLQQYENALNVLNSTPSYEGRALLIQMFLQMNRPDVAAKEFSRLQSMKDDAIATQLSSTWINLAMGQNRVTDALETFQELIDKYGPSVSLLNGLAVANLHAGNIPNAERVLRDALLIDNKDATTHVNLAVVTELQAHLIPRMLARVAPQHPWLIATARAEEHFDRTLAQFNQQATA